MILRLYTLFKLYLIYGKLKFPLILKLFELISNFFYVIMLIKRVLFFTLIPWFMIFVSLNRFYFSHVVIKISYFLNLEIQWFTFIFLCIFMRYFLILLALGIKYYTNVFLQLFSDLLLLFFLSKIVFCFLKTPYQCLLLLDGIFLIGVS